MTLTPQQLQERTGYIGASDAAAVLGLSRWGTPLGVWTEKTGRLRPKDLKDSLPVEVGNCLESLVAKLFTRRTGLKVRRVPKTLTHPEYPFIKANWDYEVIKTGEPLECKTASSFKAKEWEGEEIPQEYVIQVLHQMSVAPKVPGAWVAVLIGGNVAFVYRRVPRDRDLIRQITEREVHYWLTYVVPKKRPGIITKNDAGTLYRLFPAGDDGSAPAVLGDEADALLDVLDALKQDYSVVKGQMNQAENALKAMLGDKSVGITTRFRVSWWNENQRRVDLDALKKEMPEVYARFAHDAPKRTFRWRKRMARYQA